MGKRLLTLVLDDWKSCNLSIAVIEQSNSRCLVDVYASTCGVHLFDRGVHLWVYLHISVGFCVARSDGNGQCKSLQSWDG